MLVGRRQRDSDLTIVLLAKLTAILPGDADRMNALLGKSRVVDDPGAYPVALLDSRKNKGSNRRSKSACDQSALATKWCSD